MRKEDGPRRGRGVSRRDARRSDRSSGRPAETGSWTESVRHLHAFSLGIRTVCDWDELCDQMASLFGSTGCAVIRWDAVGECGHPIGVVGQWENEDLAGLLAEGRGEWALALPDAPVVASRLEGRVRATPVGPKGDSRASAVSVPLRVEEQRLGAIVLSYPSPRVIDRETLAGGELLSIIVSLLCNQQELAGTVERQAKRIARLVDDIERMSISLRASSPRDDGTALTPPS